MLYIFMDETGDHSLDKIDPDFPVFVLVMIACDVTCYDEMIVPYVNDFKLSWFGTTDITLHSRDIRKGIAPFAFIHDEKKKQLFYEDINQLITSCDYKIIAIAIRKDLHKQRYGSYAQNPYTFSLELALERVCSLDGICDGVQIIAEARGKKEDRDLLTAFQLICETGTKYVSARELQEIPFKTLEFKAKRENIIGTQLADLIAYPIARHVLNPRKSHPSYDIFSSKVHALKIFP